MQPRYRSQLFAVEAREWRTHPDTASAALRIGDLRSAAGPEPADSVAQYAKRRKLETNERLFSGSPVSQNLGCERTSRSQRSRMAVDLGFFAFNHLELILFEV